MLRFLISSRERSGAFGLPVRRKGIAASANRSVVAGKAGTVRRQFHGELRKPDRPIPIVGPDVNVDVKPRIQPWRCQKAQLIVRIAKGKAAAVIAQPNSQRCNLSTGSQQGRFAADQIAQPKPQPVRLKLRLDRWEDLGPGNPETSSASD